MFTKKRHPFFRNEEAAGASAAGEGTGLSDTTNLGADEIEKINAETKEKEVAGEPRKEAKPLTDEFGQPIVAEKKGDDAKPKNLDALSGSLEDMEKEYEKKNPKALTEEQKKEKEESEKAAAEAAKKKQQGSTTTESQKKQGGGDGNESDAEFEFKSPEIKNEENEEVIESTWQNTAEQLGLGKIQNDDFDEFKATFEARLAAERKAGREEAQSINILEEFPAESQAEAKEAITLLKAGKSLTSLVEPLKPYQEVLAMSNEDRVRAMYKGQGHKDEWIDAEVERQREAGTIDHLGEQIATNVTNFIEKKKAEIVAQAERSVEQIKATIQAEREKEDTALIGELRKRSTWMGGKVSDKAMSALEAKVKSGEYRRRLKSDPSMFAEAILYHEFGKQAESELRRTEFEKGRGTFREKLHNTKSGVGAEGGRKTAGTEVPKGFDGWDAIMKAEEEGASVDRAN